MITFVLIWFILSRLLVIIKDFREDAWESPGSLLFYTIWDFGLLIMGIVAVINYLHISISMPA